jgi:protein-tyrosine phosphatase
MPQKREIRKILMVCLGNICRSPLAQGILASKLNSDFYVIDSAGTANYHAGSKPDPRSIAVAKKYGLDISHQSARQFKVADFDNFDIIYAMDDSNFDDIINLSRTDADRSKVHLLLNENTSSKFNNVPDPYYGGTSGFEDVYNMLDETCEIIAQRLLK